jgi:hypothetical protein
MVISIGLSRLKIQQVVLTSAVFMLSVMSTLAEAEVAKGPKRPAAEWGAAWEGLYASNIAGETSPGFLSRVGVVKKSGAGFQVLPLEQKDADQHSFMAVPEERELNLARFANKVFQQNPENKPTTNPCEVSHQSIAICLGLDALLDVSNPKWKLLKFNKQKKSVELLLEAPGASDEDYFKWIHSQLNYDGVVIDVEGDYLLVLLPPGRAGDEIQALTLKDSADKIFLPPSTVKGTSLLQLIQRSGRFAVFLPVITSAEAAKSFVKGSKLIIEKGK